MSEIYLALSKNVQEYHKPLVELSVERVNYLALSTNVQDYHQLWVEDMKLVQSFYSKPLNQNRIIVHEHLTFISVINAKKAFIL